MTDVKKAIDRIADVVLKYRPPDKEKKLIEKAISVQSTRNNKSGKNNATTVAK